MQATIYEIIESIADDVNDTIRLEYRLGGSFTVIESKIPTSCDMFGLDEVKEYVDYNLIGA